MNAHDRIQSIHESEAKLVETAVDKAWAAERGKLTRRGTRQMLMSLFDDPTHEPTKEGLDRIMNAIDEDAESDEDGGTRRRLTACVKKYRAYLEHQSLVDSLFVSFDADQSGTLQRDELLSLLRSIAENPDQMREQLGMGQTPYSGIDVTLEEDEMAAALTEVRDASSCGRRRRIMLVPAALPPLCRDVRVCGARSAAVARAPRRPATSWTTTSWTTTSWTTTSA